MTRSTATIIAGAAAAILGATAVCTLGAVIVLLATFGLGTAKVPAFDWILGLFLLFLFGLVTNVVFRDLRDKLASMNVKLFDRF